jgi:hypothetical protein
LVGLGGVFYTRMRGGGSTGLYSSLLGSNATPSRAQQGSAADGNRNLFDSPFGTGADGSQNIALQDLTPAGGGAASL